MISYEQDVMSHYDVNKKIVMAWIQKDRCGPKKEKKEQVTLPRSEVRTKNHFRLWIQEHCAGILNRLCAC